MRIDRKKLHVLMFDKEITSVALAQKSGVSRATICCVRSGKSCSDEVGRKIAKALGVDVNELLER